MCLPWAGVHDATDRRERITSGSSKDSVVVVHVGINDIGCSWSLDPETQYRALLEKIRESGRKCVLLGVLPKMGCNAVWASRIINIEH